jgi:hypothetical protein
LPAADGQVQLATLSCEVGERLGVRAAEAAALRSEDLAAVQQQVRRRVLCWFARAGHLDAADARDMASWDHGGGFWLRPLRLTPAKPSSLHRNFAIASFSLDASIRIEGPDRAGLERLLRYCARPPFALERLEQLGDDALHLSLRSAAAR